MNQTSPTNTATAAGAAAIVAPLVAWIAGLFRVTLPPEVLSALVVLIVAGAHWVGQYAANRGAKASTPSTQAGFASPGFVWALAVLAVVACAFLAGCANPPTPTQANQIRMACAADAGIRPSVDVMLAIPNLAKPEEVAGITAARAIIDPICKDPTAPFAGDPYVAVTQASATVAGILVQVEARKAGK